MSNPSSEELINDLCNTLCCKKRMAHPLCRVIPWILLALIYIGGAVEIFGFRADIITSIQSPGFIFEILLVLWMSLSAAFCTIWLCIPDMRGQKWMIVMPLTLFGVVVLFLGLRFILESFVLPHISYHFCYVEALVFGIIPAVAIFFFSVSGKTTHPVLLSFMNTLSVGGMGYLGLRLTCASNDIGHIGIFHILPYILFGLVSAVAARQIFKW